MYRAEKAEDYAESRRKQKQKAQSKRSGKEKLRLLFVLPRKDEGFECAGERCYGSAALPQVSHAPFPPSPC